MKIDTFSTQNYTGKLVIVDKFGKEANPALKRELLSQLGSTVPELKQLISPKNFNLFISRRQIDYISINANKTYAGVARGETTFRSLHKSILNKIVEVAKSSILEYEKHMQKHV